MNLKTLKKNADRTPEELQAMSRKGGIASVKKRREMKEAREYMKAILSLPLESEIDAELLEANGFHEKNLNMFAGMIIGQVRKAAAGDTRAAELVLKVIGEYPAEKAEIVTEEKNPMFGQVSYFIDENDKKFIRLHGNGVTLSMPDNGRDKASWEAIARALDVDKNEKVETQKPDDLRDF